MEILSFVAALVFALFVAPIWIIAHYSTRESIALAERKSSGGADRLEAALGEVDEEPRRNAYWRRRALLKARRRR